MTNNDIYFFSFVLFFLPIFLTVFYYFNLSITVPKVVSSVGLGAASGTRRWGVRTPTGADFPRLWKKTPLAVLLMTWAVLSAWARPDG